MFSNVETLKASAVSLPVHASIHMALQESLDLNRTRGSGIKLRQINTLLLIQYISLLSLPLPVFSFIIWIQATTATRKRNSPWPSPLSRLPLYIKISTTFCPLRASRPGYSCFKCWWKCFDVCFATVKIWIMWIMFELFPFGSDCKILVCKKASWLFNAWNHGWMENYWNQKYTWLENRVTYKKEKKKQILILLTCLSCLLVICFLHLLIFLHQLVVLAPPFHTPMKQARSGQ